MPNSATSGPTNTPATTIIAPAYISQQTAAAAAAAAAAIAFQQHPAITMAPMIPMAIYPFQNSFGIPGAYGSQSHVPLALPQLHSTGVDSVVGRAPSRKWQKRQCSMGGCENPLECPGAYNHKNCRMIIGSDPSRGVVRTVASYTRMCRVDNCPDRESCPGHNDQSRCLG
jgi:hypothetical protein